MPNNSTANNEISVISDSYEKAVESLSTHLVVNATTATNITEFAMRQQEPARVYTYLIHDFPQVLHYHISNLQTGEKLHQRNEHGDWRYRYGPFVSNCVFKQSATDSSECYSYSFGFKEFFEHVLFDLIDEKFSLLLFNLQSLNEQIGIIDLHHVYSLIQKLNEDGVKELLDFSWHCKGHRMMEAIDKMNATSIISWRAKNIPDEVQLGITNQPGFPANMQKADRALEKVLMIDRDTRIKILQATNAMQIKLIPGFADILQTKAAYAKLTPGGVDSLKSFRNHLLYTEFPTDDYELFYKTRFRMTELMPGGILDLFASDALLKRTKSLPAILCQNQPNCYGVIRQEHNIREYVKGLSLLSEGQQPSLSFRTMLPPPVSPGLISELPVEVIALGLGMVFGAGIFVANSLRRQFTFFGKCFSRNQAAPINPPATETTQYSLVRSKAV